MGGLKSMNFLVSFKISCGVKETDQTQLMCETEPSEM